VGSHSITRPPYSSTARRFTGEALRGMTTWAGMPRSFAARARAWAWFPELCVTTPRAAASGDRLRTALQAPRNLKAPAFWKFSHLKKGARPASRSSVAQVITGVRWAQPAIRWAAARTAARSGAYVVVMGSLYSRDAGECQRGEWRRG